MAYRTIGVLNTRALRRRVERPRRTLLWGQEHIVIPRLLEAVFGDGKKLIGLRPIRTRPNYYVVRIDSSWSTSNWETDHPMKPRAWLDDVYAALEERFGNGCDDEGQEKEDAYFPEALLGTGTEWFEIDPKRFRCRGGRPKELPLSWDQRGTPKRG